MNKNKNTKKFRYDRLVVLLALLAITFFIIYFIIKLIIAGFNAIFPDKREIPEDVRYEEDYTLLVPTVQTDTDSDNSNNEITPLIYSDYSQQLEGAVSSKYCLLYCVEDRNVIARKASKERFYPASMTKIMTLIVAVENITDLSETVEMTYEVINPLYLQGATITGFKSGDKVTIEDLLYGIVLPSGADATVTIAQYVSGSEEEFVKLMNKKAEELGLEDTHFTNTSGLHDTNHYTTAYDMGIILEHAISNETCRRILSTTKYTTKSTTTDESGNQKNIEFYSTMLKNISSNSIEGVTICGGKTGYTSESMYCLASFAQKNNRTYIAITAGAPVGYERGVWTNIINDVKKLYSEYI